MKKTAKKTTKKISLKSFTRKEELLKLAQFTEVLAFGTMEADLRLHLQSRVKELVNKLF